MAGGGEERDEEVDVGGRFDELKVIDEIIPLVLGFVKQWITNLSGTSREPLLCS